MGDGFFAVTASVNQSGAPRLGLAVAVVRAAGGAVARNRIRRIIRESFRLHQREIPAVDLVVSMRPRARDATGEAAAREPRGTVEEGRRAMRHVAALLIRLYQWTVSPLLGPACRFYPPARNTPCRRCCAFGVLRGGWLALRAPFALPPFGTRAGSIPCRLRPSSAHIRLNDQ